uniref:Glycosyltransferase n=1 Tax=viral metagenome TaxID=1070528 RepID=A0A6C0BLW7_9ZZZZ
MANPIYLIAHRSAHRAFEDYYQNLSWVWRQKSKQVTIVIFEDASEIPPPVLGDEIYFFLSYIPPVYLQRWQAWRSAMAVTATGAKQPRLRPRIYLINTEQSTRPIWNRMLHYYCDQGIPIIDYDQYQTELIESWTKQTKKLEGCCLCLLDPVSPLETRRLTALMLPQSTEKPYQVAFCSVNRSKRRQRISQQLQQRGIRVLDVSGWNEARDQQIAQAQVLVNVHYDPQYQIFEHLRCDRWILSGMLVISESSASDDLLDCKNLLITAPYETLVTTIIDVIQNYPRYYEHYLACLEAQQVEILDARRKRCEQLIRSIGKK